MREASGGWSRYSRNGNARAALTYRGLQQGPIDGQYLQTVPVILGVTFKAPVLTASIPEQRHTQHQPEYLLTGQSAAPKGGLAEKVEGRLDALDADMPGKGAEIGERVPLFHVEQGLQNRHRESGIQ
ncbi:hypothetical protein WH50_10400 [Pokkaliibacter plantistimulans]|uniref:Uncharacterized protein n=1 Tax=Pokkaliibacter plantistimulans TaxID=1635171 RepID=A0ABX5LXD7_9GAMM|nr:hypothetical protein WH50_10400 [Pokkaliibacter plantistimulans]